YRNVTGVQTCALPISRCWATDWRTRRALRTTRRGLGTALLLLGELGRQVGGILPATFSHSSTKYLNAHRIETLLTSPAVLARARSEERRVGKGRGSRW